MLARVVTIGRQRFNASLDFDPNVVKTHAQPSPEAMPYRSEKRWPVSRFWPHRRPVLASSAINVRAILWNNEKPDEKHINELVHWSVVERISRGGLVEGEGRLDYRVPPYKNPTGDIPKESIFHRVPEESGDFSS